MIRKNGIQISDISALKLSSTISNKIDIGGVITF